MEYLSVKQYAEAHGLPERTVRNWCASGKIQGAFLIGKTWNIPTDASMPERTKRKISPRELSKGLVSISYKDRQPIYQLKFKKV